MRIAWRNLLRNRWRSALTACGVAVAVSVIIWMAHMMDAFMAEMIQGATRAELGDLQVHSQAYVDEQNLYNTFTLDAASIASLRMHDGVKALTPRVHAWGLVGHEQTAQTARLLGIDPVHEPRVTRTEASLIAGSWFPVERPTGNTQVILGKGLADQLHVQVGDELVVMLQAADGSLGNDALDVIGIVETHNTTIDRQAAFLRIDDLQWIAALDGRFHELAATVTQRSQLDHTVQRLTDALEQKQLNSAPHAPLVVRSWRALEPELSSMSELSKRSMWIFYGVIYFVAGLGLLNTQRMTAYERRREFGVLLAIGTLPRRLVVQVLSETAMLTFVGAVLGVALGVLGVVWHSRYGFALGEGGFDYMGVHFSQRLYFQLDWRQTVIPVMVVVAVGAICSLIPAIKASRLDIPTAISGRQ